jgi:hypothetical protein
MTTTQSAADQQRAADTIQEQEALMGLRGNWETTWEAIAARIFTMYAGQFNTQNLSNPMSGQQRTTEQVDATGAGALVRFAAAMESMLTPRNSRWHRLAPSNKILRRDRSVMLWFEDLADVLFDYRYAPRANFASQKHEEYMGLGAFGTACQFIDALQFYGEQGIRYRNMHLGQIYFKENHQGIIDTAYRRFSFTARQAVQRFQRMGMALPQQILDDAKLPQGTEKPHFFIHCVKPREDYEASRVDVKGMRYASYYVSLTERRFLKENGYHTFPYTISRYVTAPNETYGRSPAMQCLPSLRLLNEQKKTFIKQGHRISDPILLAHDDGILDMVSLKPGSGVPGGVNADGKLLVQPLPTGNINTTVEMMDMERETINDAFLVSLFQILVDQPQMTATEVVERAREKGALLSPTMGRQQSEALGPLIEREIDVLTSLKLIPPMPQKLLDARGEYLVEYDSPLSRMAKAEESSGFMQTVDWAAEKAQLTGNMAIMDHFNFDVGIPKVAENRGVPASWMNGADTVAKTRADRMKQAQTQQMIDAAPAIASTAKTASGLMAGA